CVRARTSDPRQARGRMVQARSRDPCACAGMPGISVTITSSVERTWPSLSGSPARPNRSVAHRLHGVACAVVFGRTNEGVFRRFHGRYSNLCVLVGTTMTADADKPHVIKFSDPH